MLFISKLSKCLSILVVPVLLLTAQRGIQAAPVTMTTSVSSQGANYLYDFAITNYSSTNPDYNLISVDLSFPAGTVIGMATAPSGNGETTDPSGDFVEFTSDYVSGFPTGTTVDGFQFLSSARYSSFAFTANYLDSTGSILAPYSGTTSPAASAVPEPASWGLLALASLFLLSRSRLLRAR